ncbi:MAG: sigma 54-interacting transcriptional regulator, partial [Calditrichota bacterium]
MYHCDILIVDDEQMVRSSLQRLLESESWRITTAGGVRDAEKILTDRRFDLAVIDYKLEDGTGLDVLEFIQHQNLDVITIILTAYGNISLAVETVKMGAYDFLEKESDPEILRHVVGKALERVHLKKEVEILQENCRCTDDQHSIVAGSPVMQRVMKIADEYARYTATVLIDGETGTGKSLLAEYIHCQGERKDRPFITINCGSIPKELIESELFGYEKGAFTGASK